MERKGGMGIAAVIGLVVFLVMHWDGMAGREAPAFSLQQAYGGRVDLSAYRGRPVLLVFWATSCGICRHELPLLDRLNTEFRAKGVDVLAINIRDLDGAREFMQTERLHLTNLIDVDGETAQRYEVHGIPKLVLIGADGKIRRTAAGWQDEQTLRGWLESAGT
ncbi:MAG TPA: TlpA disulfide reductase family protein [Bryobacteraceae bacterium]|nr:TlpA disulfide reductase family protein [Bryobacteraceae bacterium]